MSAYRMTPEQAGELSLAEQHEWFAAKHSRRRILRGGLVGAGAIAGTALVGNGVASAAPTTNVIGAGERVHGSAVAPYGRHINFGSDPTTEMIVSWQVRTPVNAPFIRLGTCPGEYGARVPAELRPLTSQLSWMHPIDSEPLVKPTTVTQYYLHAHLQHLMPATRPATRAWAACTASAPRRAGRARSPSPRSATRASATTRWPTAS